MELITCKTASQFINRLHEVEKIMIMHATPEQLEYLGDANFYSDNVSRDVLLETRDILVKTHQEDSKTDGFLKATWLF